MALHIIDHPLVQHKLSIMRNKETSTNKFRGLLKEIAMLMGYEVTRDFPLTYKEIETPLQKMNAPTIAGKKVVIAPILRAGLGHLVVVEYWLASHLVAVHTDVAHACRGD